MATATFPPRRAPAVTAPGGRGAERHEDARRSRVVRRWPAGQDVALLVGLIGLAALVRWPGLFDVPRWTDEMGEVIRAVQVVERGTLPLTNVDAYIGPLWIYLLAGAFALFGLSAELPRLLVFVSGALTVGATFLLGRVAFGRSAGVIAAALLLTAPWHVLVQSRIAWSNSLTPLLTTLAILAVAGALATGRGALLAPAGLLVGLALQTHPSAAGIVPGLALAVLLDGRGRRWLFGPWPWLAALAAIVGYAPVIAYNVIHPWATLTEARAVTYAVADPDGDRYLTVLVNLPGRMLHDLVGVAIGPALERGWLPWPASPLAWPMAALAVGALAYGLWARRWLLLAVAASAVLTMPLLSHEYAGGRYIASAWPPLLVLVGGTLAALTRLPLILLRRRGAPSLRVFLAARRAAPVLAGLFALGLALVPLPSLLTYHRTAAEDGRTNDPFGALAETARSGRLSDRPVLIDERLQEHGATFKEGSGAAILRYLLLLRGVPTGLLSTTPTTAEWLAGAPGGTVAILTAETRDALAARGLVLEPLGEAAPILTPAQSSVNEAVHVHRSSPVQVYRLAGDSGAPADEGRGLTLLGSAPLDGWEVGGWSARVLLDGGPAAPDGSRSLAITFEDRFAGVAVTGDRAVSTAGFDRLELDVHGERLGGQEVQVSLRDETGEPIRQVALARFVAWGGIGAGEWRRVSIPLADLGASERSIRGVQLQSLTRDAQPELAVANVRLVAR